MIFLQQGLTGYLIAGLAFIILSVFLVERGFFRWVESYWFLKRSPWHWLGSIFMAAGLILLSIILLDPRSGEIKVKGKVKQDRTIILIDTSTSMLAEDVRPNRLEKAIMMAKHFVRKAVGHQISLMVFADISKKLVPFTSDVDLLDARLDSIKTLRNLNAGSSIGLAIEEAVQYFDIKDKSVSGNIIVITDGEDNADTASFKVPENISLVLIGVGTAEGGPIPLKDSMGFHHGNKRQGAVTVVTKLNEAFFKNALADVKNGRSFIVRSYDLPTDQILEFLNQKKSAEKEGENMIRPVAMEFWAIPGLILLIVGMFIRSFRPFMVAMLILSVSVHAQEQELPADVLLKLEQLREGKLDRKERINLADQLAKAKAHKLAQEIYQENLDSEPVKGNEDSYFNRATSELEAGNMPAALQHFDQLEKEIRQTDPKSPMIEKIRENIRQAIMPKKENKKQDKKKDEQKESDKKDQQGEGKDQNPSQGDKGEGKPQDSKEGDDKNPFDPKNKDKNKPQDQQDKADEKSGEEKNKDQQQNSGDEGKEEKRKPRPKPSPLLEQLKQDDRKLQNKLLDVSTQKRKPGKRKDW